MEKAFLDFEFNRKNITSVLNALTLCCLPDLYCIDEIPNNFSFKTIFTKNKFELLDIKIKA